MVVFIEIERSAGHDEHLIITGEVPTAATGRCRIGSCKNFYGIIGFGALSSVIPIPLDTAASIVTKSVGRLKHQFLFRFLSGSRITHEPCVRIARTRRRPFCLTSIRERHHNAVHAAGMVVHQQVVAPLIGGMRPMIGVV